MAMLLAKGERHVFARSVGETWHGQALPLRSYGPKWLLMRVVAPLAGARLGLCCAGEDYGLAEGLGVGLVDNDQT